MGDFSEALLVVTCSGMAFTIPSPSPLGSGCFGSEKLPSLESNSTKQPLSKPPSPDLLGPGWPKTSCTLSARHKGSLPRQLHPLSASHQRCIITTKRFITLPSRKQQLAATTATPADASPPKRWSGIVAGRESRYPKAAKQVFAIPELCENILERLSQTEVISAHRIRRDIKAIIKASPKLQAKPFLKALPEHKPEAWISDANFDMLVGDEKVAFLAEAAAKGVTPLRIKPVIAHPLILANLHSDTSFSVRDCVKWHFRKTDPTSSGGCELFIYCSFGTRGPALESTCYTMFLTQPPQTRVIAYVNFRPVTLVNPNGVTLRDVVGLMKSPGDTMGAFFFPDAFVVTKKNKVDYEWKMGNRL